MKQFKATNAFKFKKFSQKQLQVLTWWMNGSPCADCIGVIADGSIRSGKTISMSLSYAKWATENFDECNFAICGRTVGSCRRNVIQELKKMLRACKSGKFTYQDHRSDNLLVISGYSNSDGKMHTNNFYVFGGKDESSQDLIQGITLAGVLLDEVALMPESFVNQATGRCSVKGSKLWFNCNPEGPYHWFKKGWIDNCKDKQLLYLHFTMDDNLSLDTEIKQRYMKMYSGMFYKRYIEGIWVMAEGIIYDMFDPVQHVKTLPNYLDYWDYKYVSIDYGTENPCTFGMFGVRGEHIHEIKSYYYDGRNSKHQKTDREYAEDLKDFIGDAHPKYIIVDPSASSFITELMNYRYHFPTVLQANNSVIDGIRTVSTYLQQNLFSIDPSCEDDIREFYSYRWNEKASQRGEEAPIKENDHAMDKIRYGIYTLFGNSMQIKYADAVYAKGQKVVNNDMKEMLRRTKHHVF